MWGRTWGRRTGPGPNLEPCHITMQGACHAWRPIRAIFFFPPGTAFRTTVEEGGETVLPHADQKVSGEAWSECAKRGLAVKPVRGDALMFYSLKPDGSNDPASLHGSCPTLKGDKWSATKWIHVGPIG
jgi:hypothetical protein